MPQLTRKITLTRLAHPLALAPLLASIAALAAIAHLTSGGHVGTRASGPAPLARARRAPCASGSPATRIAAIGPAEYPPRSAIGGALATALRAASSHMHGLAATAAVVACGRVLWADATGAVDLRSRRPANNRSLFILNSAAKTIVATMVMLEIQHGELSLDTKLARFYPWLPNARQISVRMLLDMRSGLPDYLYNQRIEWTMRHQPRHRWSVDQVLTGLGTGLGAARFPPGRGFQYSDTNYILLGAILERITHSSIQRDFEQLVGRPLGITSATFAPGPAAEARLAHPYLLYRDGSLTTQWISGYGVSSAVWGPVFTDGGLASSSLDLAWFANALLGARLVDAAALAQMTRIGGGDYGFGMRSRSFDGRLWLGHRGYFGGFEAEDWTDPARQVTIAAATNLQLAGGPPTSTSIWMNVARALDRRRIP